MAQVYSAGPSLCLVSEKRTIQATEAARCQFTRKKRERSTPINMPKLFKSEISPKTRPASEPLPEVAVCGAETGSG